MERQIALSALARHLPGVLSTEVPDIHITGIALDSRLVKPGNLFIALTGGTADGHRFIPDAQRRGAAAVVGTQPIEGLPVPYLRVEDGRQALAILSAAFYDFPAHRLTVIGVTGTDGKTTTCSLIYQILLAAGLKAGLVSTVSAVIGEQVLDTGFHVTTPEAPDVQRFLAQMVEAGLTHVVLEATSHGLEQQRVASCEFDIGVVTNITHEHLDYHGDYPAYRAAKARLFAGLGETPAKPHGNPRLAVLNRDDSSFQYLRSVVETAGRNHPRWTSYGLDPRADFSADEVRASDQGLSFMAVLPSRYSPQASTTRLPISTNLTGKYNVFNCLAALAAAVSGLEIPLEAVQRGMIAQPGIPGRMERIDLGQEFRAIVDFAHTPNALRCSLEAVRQLAPGRVIAVFGSAGLRDRAKRRMMAETAAGLADRVVLTAEDPRTESLESILAEMAAGAVARGGIEGQTFWRIPDRGEALRFAVSLAHRGDVVIACGKGHEQSMCFGETEYLWDDRTALRAALAERLGIPGPQMPFLPTQERGYNL